MNNNNFSPPAFDAVPLGKRLREVRKDKLNSKGKPVTVEELAAATGLLPNYITQIECGFKTPSLNYLVYLMEALRAEPNYIFQDYYDYVRIGQSERDDITEYIVNELSSLPPQKLQVVYDMIKSLKKI